MAISIVPIHPDHAPDDLEPSELYDPAKRGRVPSGHLTYRGGPILSSVRVVPAFAAPYDRTLQDDICAFLAWFVGGDGPMVGQLAEYAVSQHPIGPGSVAAAVNLAWKPRSVVSDSTLRRHLGDQIRKGALEAATPNSLYALYLPSGVVVSDQGSSSCQVFCGYHDAIAASSAQPELYYAVLPYPDCDGCLGGLSPLDAITSVSSHEICEAVTDPVPGKGWYDDKGGEVGDLCAWNQDQAGGHTYQQEWSNRAGACV